MSLIISCETKSNAWEGMSLASLSDWFQGFRVFLLRYSLKKQQPDFLMKVGWEEWEGLDLIMHFYGSLEEILLWKHAILMWQVNQMWAVAVRRPKSSMKFWIHMRSQCSNIGLKTPVFLSSKFPCRDISLEMNTESEMENRASWAACVAPLVVKPSQNCISFVVSSLSKRKQYWLSLQIILFTYCFQPSL